VAVQDYKMNCGSLFSPDDGEVIYDGQNMTCDPSYQDKKVLRQQIGNVFQGSACSTV